MSSPAASLPAVPSNRWLIAMAVSLGALMEIVDTTIVNVAIADMQAQMGASATAIGWVVTSYAVANVIILPLSAWLGDTFGKKRFFVFSLVAFTGASVMCGLANSLAALITSRVLQGLFGGGLLAKAQSFLFETFPAQEQAKAQALFGAVVIAGPAIGPVLGGWLVTEYQWRWIFFVNVPVGLLAGAMCVLFLPRDPPFRGITRRIDYWAILGLAVGLGSLQVVLEEGQTEDWFDSSFIRYFAVASVCGCALFLWRSLREREPLVDLRVLRYRSLQSGCLIGFLVGVALNTANYAVPQFAQRIMGLTAEQSGLMLLPGALASAVAMGVGGQLLGRGFDPRVMICAGIGLAGTSTYHLASLATTTTRAWFTLPLMARGFAIPWIFLPVNLMALGPVPKKDVAAATGLFSLIRTLGGSIGIAVLTVLLERRQAVHRNVLTSHLSAVDPGVAARVQHLAQNFVAHGTDVATARQQALTALDGAVTAQGAILSYGDITLLTSGIFVCMLPFVLLLKRPQRGAKVSMGH